MSPMLSQPQNLIPEDRRKIRSNPMLRYCRGELKPGIDSLALEAPLNVFLDGHFAGTTMRTPGADKDLSVGMLFTSGRISGPEDAAGMSFLMDEETVRLISGPKSAAYARPRGPRPELPAERMSQGELARDLLDMRDILESAQRLYRHTGATHCAMFFDQKREPLAFGEDVGRHNAFDKCAGRCLIQDSLHRAHYALISSRLSHEIVKKAVRTGIRVLAGFSVATSIALELAQAHGIILVGRLRNETMNMYPAEDS